MGKVVATITTSVDGYFVGPQDGPGRGLGIGGERLHYWVMGEPWTYRDKVPPMVGMQEADRGYFGVMTAGLRVGVVGRGMYEAAGAWGGVNPYPGPLVVVTHRTADQPDPEAGFRFVDGFVEAMRTAQDLAGDGAVSIGGGADIIRQGLTLGVIDELGVSTAPVLLGRGRRLFDGFERDVDLDVLGTWSSPFATHVRYAVRR